MEPKRVWVKSRSHMLSSENVEKVRIALISGCVFGHQYHYYGGSAFTIWAHSNFTHFMEHISQSRPGDWYVIWSTAQLVDKKLALVTAKYNDNIKPGAHLVPETQIQTIENYLEKNRDELIAVFHRPDEVDARMYERDELVDFIELLQDFSQPGGEVFVFPMNDIDTKDHVLVEAKYPNEKGEVPIGGAY